MCRGSRDLVLWPCSDHPHPQQPVSAERRHSTGTFSQAALLRGPAVCSDDYIFSKKELQDSILSGVLQLCLQGVSEQKPLEEVSSLNS